jgi:hypothetical protein
MILSFLYILFFPDDPAGRRRGLLPAGPAAAVRQEARAPAHARGRGSDELQPQDASTSLVFTVDFQILKKKKKILDFGLAVLVNANTTVLRMIQSES